MTSNSNTVNTTVLLWNERKDMRTSWERGDDGARRAWVGEWHWSRSNRWWGESENVRIEQKGEIQGREKPKEQSLVGFLFLNTLCLPFALRFSSSSSSCSHPYQTLSIVFSPKAFTPLSSTRLVGGATCVFHHSWMKKPTEALTGESRKKEIVKKKLNKIYSPTNLNILPSYLF